MSQSIFTKEQIQGMFTNFKDMASSYQEKPANISDQDWLSEQYKSAFPDLSKKEADALSSATFHGVSRFQDTLQEVSAAAASGKSKEQWFAEKTGKDLQHMDLNACGETLQSVDQALLAGNNQMLANDTVQVVGDDLVISTPEQPEEAPSDTTDWNSFTIKDTLLNIGQNAALMGLQTMGQSKTFDFTSDAIRGLATDSGQPITVFSDPDKTEQLKALLAASIKIGAGSGKLPILPKSLSADTAATMASHAVEYYSALSQFSNGKLTLMQAMDRVGMSGVSFIYNIFNGEGLTNLGRMLIAHIPVVGPVLSNVLAPVISMFVNKTLHETLQKTLHKVENTVRTAVNNAWNKVKAVGRKIKNAVKSFCSWLFA